MHVSLPVIKPSTTLITVEQSSIHDGWQEQTTAIRPSRAPQASDLFDSAPAAELAARDRSAGDRHGAQIVLSMADGSFLSLPVQSRSSFVMGGSSRFTTLHSFEQVAPIAGTHETSARIPTALADSVTGAELINGDERLRLL